MSTTLPLLGYADATRRLPASRSEGAAHRIYLALAARTGGWSHARAIDFVLDARSLRVEGHA